MDNVHNNTLMIQKLGTKTQAHNLETGFSCSLLLTSEAALAPGCIITSLVLMSAPSWCPLTTVCPQLDPVSQSRGTEIVADRSSRGGDTGDPGTTVGQREREGSAEIVRTQMSLGDSGPSSSVTLLMSRNFGPNI